MITSTIVAMATPPGRGGVSILRISGSQAVYIARQITQLNQITPRKVQFSSFYDLQGKVLDQGILLYFPAPHSFTGEEVIELQVHGSPMVVDLLIQVCLRLGAVLAKPGEFSERAFLNNKIDLTQAEAIADLISASSETAARMALSSLQGEFSHKIYSLNEKIIYLRLYVEAAIDFPDEEIDFLNDGRVIGLLEEIIKELELIRKQAGQGAIIREGISVVIAGRPNAGKSTLINQLAGREVAIVTEIAGTTRDVMREYILLDDIPVHIIDTAGLRASEDIVELEGIKRAWKELAKADCVLLLVDIADQETPLRLTQEIKEALPKNIPIITVFNKIDTLGFSAKTEKGRLFISAKSGEGLSLLKEKIKKMVGYHPMEGQFLARRRHLSALDKAYKLLLDGKEQLSSHQAGELLAEDLRLSHQALGEITGEFSTEDLLGKIFSSFCIGK